MRKVRMTAMALALLTALALIGGPVLAESTDATQRTATGRVTAVSAASITMDLGIWTEAAAPDTSSGSTVKPNAAAAGATAPDNTITPESAASEATTPETTAPEATVPGSATAPETTVSDANQTHKDQTNPAQAPTQDGFTASGESMTFSVTESTRFTLGMRSAKGSISDISVGSILTVQLTGDAATSVTILQPRGFERGFDRFDDRNGDMQGRDFGQPGDRFGFGRGNGRQDGSGWQGNIPGQGQNGGSGQPGCPNCPFANAPGQGANGNQNLQPGQGNAAPGA